MTPRGWAAAAAPYRTAGDQAFESVRPRIDAIRAELDATIAPLNEQLRAAVTGCRATFEAAFEAALTPEQLALWQTLKG